MDVKKIFVRLIILMACFFMVGIGVSIYKRFFQSNWSSDGIQGIKDSCIQTGRSQEFCECYTNKIISRISMRDFFKMTQNMRNSEAETAKAKKFVDSVIADCTVSK